MFCCWEGCDSEWPEVPCHLSEEASGYNSERRCKSPSPISTEWGRVLPPSCCLAARLPLTTPGPRHKKQKPLGKEVLCPCPSLSVSIKIPGGAQCGPCWGQPPQMCEVSIFSGVDKGGWAPPWPFPALPPSLKSHAQDARRPSLARRPFWSHPHCHHILAGRRALGSVRTCYLTCHGVRLGRCQLGLQVRNGVRKAQAQIAQGVGDPYLHPTPRQMGAEAAR